MLIILNFLFSFQLKNNSKSHYYKAVVISFHFYLVTQVNKGYNAVDVDLTSCGL